MDPISPDPIASLAYESAVADMKRGGAVAALMLDGPPGVGKSYLGKQAAKRLKAKLLSFQFYPGCGKGELVWDSETGTEGVLVKAAKSSHEGKCVLILNEADKSDIAVDSFLLDYLNDGVLWVPQLGESMEVNAENLLVVVTKNDLRDLCDYLLRRCRCVQMEWPKPDEEVVLIRKMRPEVTDGLARVLIGWSWEMRNHPTIKKKPSPPELARLGHDLITSIVPMTSNPELIGRYVVNAMCPVMADRSHFDPKELFRGTAVLEVIKQSQDIGFVGGDGFLLS